MSKRKMIKVVDEYLNKEDWRVNENANSGYSFPALMSHASGACLAEYALYSIYTKEIAELHKNGDFHIHDMSHSIAPYCAGHSLRDLLEKGFYTKNTHCNYSAPAKHFDVALGQIVNYWGTLQNEWAGAQAFNSIDTLLAPFIHEDNLSYKQVEHFVESFIYANNVKSRFGQCCFTNITLDLVCPNDLKNTPIIIGGKIQNGKYYKDYQKEMDMFNKAFLTIMEKGDAKGNLFTFPIPTYNINKDFEWDSEIADKLFEATAKYGIPNFQNYVSSGLDQADVRAMCPLTGDTEVIVKSVKGINNRKIKDIIKDIEDDGSKFKVFFNGSWVKAKPVKTSMTKVYKITLSNGVSIKMGENHLQPTKNRGVLQAKQLEENDWLPFNKIGIDCKNIGTADFGYVIGAFAGNGSYDNNSIIYSLDISENYIACKLKDIWNRLGYNVTITDDGHENVKFVRINGDIKPYIKRYVVGENALTETLTANIFNSSMSFKKGFIEGYKDTNGYSDHHKRIYTSSKEMKNSLVKLFASLGKKVLITNEDTRENSLETNPCYRIDFPEINNYGEYYTSDNEYNYYKITSIEEIHVKDKYLYCFEVDNKENLFTLSNGLITHNCRLRIPLDKIKHRAGGLFGAEDKTGGIGVVTINMSRIGYLSDDEESFFDRLTYLLDKSSESLELKRICIQKEYDRGLLPWTKEYLHTFNNHFSIIGLLGMNEACLNFMNCSIASEKGNAFAQKVLDFINKKCLEYQEKTGHLYSSEASPAEGTCYRLAKIDKSLYPNIITAGTEVPYYTNSTQLPVDYSSDIFECLDLQEPLQTKYLGGSMFHGFLGECITKEQAKLLVKKIVENYTIPSFTITPTFSICPEHGYIAGEHYVCPKCK